MTDLIKITNGTEKQITYAEALRAKVLPMLDTAEAVLGAKEVAKPHATAAIAQIRDNADARYWLDSYADADAIEAALSKDVTRRFFVAAGAPAANLDRYVDTVWASVMVAINKAAK